MRNHRNILQIESKENIYLPLLNKKYPFKNKWSVNFTNCDLFQMIFVIENKT